MTDFKIGIAYWTLRNLSPIDAIKRAAETGFDCIQLDCNFAFIRPPEIKELKEVKETAEDCGINIIEFHGPLPGLPSPEINEEDIKLLLNLTQSLRSEYFTFHIRRDHSEFLKRLAKMGEKSGIVCTVENSVEEKFFPDRIDQSDRRIFDPEDLLKTVKEVNSPYLRICYDCNHAHAGFDPTYFFDKVKSEVALIHLSDSTKDKVEMHLPMGYGDIDFVSLFDSIKKSGFDGPMILEISPEYIDKLKENLVRIRELL